MKNNNLSNSETRQLFNLAKRVTSYIFENEDGTSKHEIDDRYRVSFTKDSKNKKVVVRDLDTGEITQTLSYKQTGVKTKSNAMLKVGMGIVNNLYNTSLGLYQINDMQTKIDFNTGN